MVDDLQSSEESAFVIEEVDRVIHTAIEQHLKDELFDENKVPQWINSICEGCVSGLGDLKKPFKYTVTCLIMQKNGAGVHTANSCYWDTVTDGVVTVKWPSDKHKDQNKTMYCVVTVFGLGL